MEKNAMLYGVVGLLLGCVLTYFVTRPSTPHNGMASMEHGGSMTMTEMTQALQNKTGDDFDKAFIKMMIEHHQGAVDMAKQAQTHAKHKEIQNLSDAIVTSQSKEIVEMKTWQKSWGYSQ